MANFSIAIKKDKVREIKATQGEVVELTDELFEGLSKANKLIVNLHEKFVGPVTELGSYQPDSGKPRYYPTMATVDALVVAFKM